MRAADSDEAALAGKPRQFFALCVPADKPTQPENEDGADEEYRWVREFTFSDSVQRDVEGSRTFAIELQPDAALYAPVRLGYALGKRKRQEFAAVPVPKKVRTNGGSRAARRWRWRNRDPCS